MKKKNIPFFIFNPLYSDKFVVKKKRNISDIITKIFWGGVPTTPKSIRFPPYSSVLGPVDLKYNRLGILCCGGLNNSDPIFSCIYAQNPKKKKISTTKLLRFATQKEYCNNFTKRVFILQRYSILYSLFLVNFKAQIIM